MSNSCDQQSTNNVNNGVPKTAGRPETTGTLLVRKVCETSCQNSFLVHVSGTNVQLSLFSLRDGKSQSVTLGSGTFTIFESNNGFRTFFSGDCVKSGGSTATGAISPGQHLTCTITNSPSGPPP